MAHRIGVSLPVRLAVALLLLALPIAAAGCSNGAAGGSGSGSPPPAEKASQAEEPAEPEYTSWVVYINDDDSYEQGGMTYSIALNLTATNPTGEVGGTYTGSATAKTSTVGDVGGAQLNASAIANSSKLEFTLADPAADGQLAQLTTDTPVYAGTGTIAMKAAGSATVGNASGPFSNASAQKLDVRAQGSKVTLSVAISGHTYTFEGTISGK